jgi:hypothetical protein
MIDPTKQAEYPIVLGERLARNPNTSRLINVNYNHIMKWPPKSKWSVQYRG